MNRCLSMRNTLAASLFCASCALAATRGIATLRPPGASLDLSTRQETEHAARRACQWLAARQSPDGSWGGPSNRTERTAVALLALAAADFGNAFSESRARAALWLDSRPPHPGEPAEAHAWRLLALLQAAPAAPERDRLAQRLWREAEPQAPPPCADARIRRLWAEARAWAVHGTAAPLNPRDHSELANLAAAWAEVVERSPADLWPHLRLLNQAGGRLETNGAPLDWRREAAQHLLAAQRIDDVGGFWTSGDCADDRIRQTAFGLLALCEL